jgi:hypothetical protein
LSRDRQATQNSLNHCGDEGGEKRKLEKRFGENKIKVDNADWMIGLNRPRPFIFIGCEVFPVGGYPKIRIRSPNTREESTQTFKSEELMTQEETRNLLKTAHASKVVNPFTRALAPPFIGRRRDFYIPKVPSNLRNISNVNTYMNVFHFLYIYKPATSSHTKPELLRRRL